MQITIIKLLLYSNYKRGKMTQVFPEPDGKNDQLEKKMMFPRLGLRSLEGLVQSTRW